MKPDLNIALGFCQTLTGMTDTVLRYRMIHDTDRDAVPREFAANLFDAWPKIEGYQKRGYACFYFLNEVGEITPHRYARDTDVIKVRAIPADIDNGDFPLQLWEWHQTPDILVHTSPGKGQALWLVKDFPLEDFKLTCLRIIAYYRSDKAVQNLSRVLRLPGTLHQKREPHLVTFEELARP